MTDAGQWGGRVVGPSHSHKLRGAANEVAKGDERTASSVLGRTTGTDHAITYGVRTLR